MGGEGGGVFEGGKAGGSKSFGIYHNGCRVVWSLWLSERHIVFVRLSSGPPGGRPHALLKAGTPREAPTPAPMTKTPSPQQLIGAARGPKQRGEHQPSNYWRGGKNCAALGAPRQLRDSTSHPSSEAGAGTYHWLQVNAWPQAGQWDSAWLHRWDVFTQWGNEGPTATATRASCHEARHGRRSLPHEWFPSAVQAVGVAPVVCHQIPSCLPFRPNTGMTTSFLKATSEVCVYLVDIESMLSCLSPHLLHSFAACLFYCVSLSVCLHLFLSPCLCAYISSCLPVCVLTSLPVSLSVCLHLFLSLCLCTYISSCLSVCVLTSLPVSLSVCLHLFLSLCLCFSVCLSVSVSVFLCVCLRLSVSVIVSVSVSVSLIHTICLYVSVSMSLSVVLSVCLCLPACLSVCLSVCLCLSLSLRYTSMLLGR